MSSIDPDIKKAVVDGIPTHWIDGPRPFTPVLMFRVGTFDESLRMRGVSHLVEHLAMYPLRDTELTFNGAAEFSTTSFWAQRHPDRVREFLKGVCESIHDLRFDRLDVESAVLEREADATITPLPADRILWSYFGPFGPGLAGARELGLRWLGPDQLIEWARRQEPIMRIST